MTNDPEIRDLARVRPVPVCLSSADHLPFFFGVAVHFKLISESLRLAQNLCLRS